MQFIFVYVSKRYIWQNDGYKGVYFKAAMIGVLVSAKSDVERFKCYRLKYVLR